MTPNFLAVIKFRIRAIRIIRGSDRLENSIHRPACPAIGASLKTRPLKNVQF